MEPNSELLESKCVWLGDLPDYQQTIFCEGCRRQCSAPDVLKCQLKGIPQPEVIVPKTKTAAPQVTAMPSRPTKPESGIGDCLKKYFDSIGAKQSAGCPCKDIQAKLNKRSPEQVLKEIDSWVGDILENVKNLSGAAGLAAKAAKYIAPNMLREKLKSEILRCLEESKAKLSQTAQNASKTDPDQNSTP